MEIVSQIYNHDILNLLLSSKSNIGKLKKHKFIINTFINLDDSVDKMIHKRKNDKHWKFREDFDFNVVAEKFKYLEDSDLPDESFHLAYKRKNNNLSLQCIIDKFEKFKSIYFTLIKNCNRFIRYITNSIYNYFNVYPTE